MKQSVKTIASSFFMALLFAVALTLMTSGVVGAQQGNSNRNNVTVTAEPEDTETDRTADKQAVKLRVQELRAEAKAEVQAKRLTRETLSADKRIKVCENRKSAINNKLSAFTAAADKHFTKFDSIYVKVLAFQEDRGVTVANIADLTADADDKQQAAADAIEALKALAVDVGCNDPETVVTLGAVRDAAQTARKALHEYRMSLKNIVVAIAQADKSEATDDTTTDTTENTTDTTTDAAEDNSTDTTTDTSTTETTQEANE